MAMAIDPFRQESRDVCPDCGWMTEPYPALASFVPAWTCPDCGAETRSADCLVTSED